MKKLFITFSAIIIMAFSCKEKAGVSPFSDQVLRIKSGQSFGMCIGKCYQEMIIENNTMILKQIERNDRGGAAETTEHYDATRLSLVKAELAGFNEKKFLRLNPVYGCPDCADGGAEWLEVCFTDGSIKKVTFEYGASAPGFEAIISALRAHRQVLIEKYR